MQKPHLTNEVQTDERVSDKEWAQREGMISFAGYPLLVEGRTVGVIAMFARQSLEQDDIEALESVAPIIAQGIERKRTEDTLRETQRLIQAIFDNSPAVIHVQDLDGRFVLVNRKFEEVVGLRSQEILGKTSFDLFPVNAAAYDAGDRQVIETGSASETEEVFTTDHGDRVFLTTKSLLADESHKPYALFGISTEITERKKAEADLREMQTELAHLNRVMTVGELAASIAHEINQPLTAIMWNANAALRWLAQTDCAILDVRLPGISGLELQQRLAADGQSIPVIIITAQGDDKTQNEAVVTGAIAFLKKPVKEEVLLAALESALNKY